MVKAAAIPALLLFALLATANAGGYRYGISDQALYAAAVLKAQTPALFPQDSPLIESQSRLMVSDDLLASLATHLGVRLPALFFGTYLVTLVALFGGAIALARALGLSRWGTMVFLVLLTLRHHIAGTGANTLEGYMHPRIFAFACGLFAVAALLRVRPLASLLWLGLGALAHPTTALWFGLVGLTAAATSHRPWRRAILVIVAGGMVAAAWAVYAGPLAGRLVTMDADWLHVLADRTYLFAYQWPLATWIVNLAYVVVIATAYAVRRRQGVAVPGEGALVAGWGALLAVFFLTLPLAASHLALAIQFQINRVFWLLDVAATAYLAWALTQGPVAATIRRRQVVLLCLLAASAARGGYVLAIETHRPLVAVDVPATPWTDAMYWLTNQPIGWNVLADPDHATKYGVSVRVAAARDTVLEAGKDPALGIYDRAIAMRVADREAALTNFGLLSTADFKRLAARYAVDVLVLEQPARADLPELYRNAQFTIYDLR